MPLFCECALNRDRIFRDRRHPIDFSDVEIKRLFRFKRRNLLQLIDELSVHLEHGTQRSQSLTPSIQISGVTNCRPTAFLFDE